MAPLISHNLASHVLTMSAEREALQQLHPNAQTPPSGPTAAPGSQPFALAAPGSDVSDSTSPTYIKQARGGIVAGNELEAQEVLEIAEGETAADLEDLSQLSGNRDNIPAALCDASDNPGPKFKETRTVRVVVNLTPVCELSTRESRGSIDNEK